MLTFEGVHIFDICTCIQIARQKLDARIMPCIFIGNKGDEKFGYRLWDLKERRYSKAEM